MRDDKHTWFIVGGITGILFIIWGSIATDARPLIPGDVWLVIPECMLLIISISGILEGLIIDMRILKYFSGIETETITLSHAANDLNMDVDHLHEKILYLKLNGKLPISFDSSTARTDKEESIVKTNKANFFISFCQRPIIKTSRHRGVLNA